MADQRQMRDAKNALSGLLLAAAFAVEPGVWPSFAAFVERNTGRDYRGTPETMAAAIQIADSMRASLVRAATGGEEP